MSVNGKCIGQLNGNVVMKNRSVGVTTMLTQWAARLIHQVEGYDLLDEMRLDNFQEMQHVFESSHADWITGAAGKPKRKKKVIKRKRRPIPQQVEGAYLRVISNSLSARTLLYIDTEGNKTFLTAMEERERPIGVTSLYTPMSFERLLQEVSPHEQENLLYFLNHA